MPEASSKKKKEAQRLRERLQDGPGPRMVLLEVLLVAGAGDA